MASVTKHGTEVLRVERPWYDIDDEMVEQRRQKRAYCRRTLADGRVKLTVLKQDFVRWRDDAPGQRYNHTDTHNWGWKVWKTLYGTHDEARDYIAKVREVVDTKPNWKVVAR